jgi:hypothetical protein
MKDFDEILDDCVEQISNGYASLEQCLELYPAEAARLEPLLRVAIGLKKGFEREPSIVYRASARLELLQHMRKNPRSSAPPHGVTAPLKIVFSLVLLMLAMLVSGTAYAQGSLPGDSFYSWKIASERAWRAVSRDPVGVDLLFAERRVNEYRTVATDPQRSQKALKAYGEVLIRLSSESDTSTRERIVPVLKNHEQSLKNAGVHVPELDQVLNMIGSGNGNNPGDSHVPQPASGSQPELPPAASNNSQGNPVVQPLAVP